MNKHEFGETESPGGDTEASFPPSGELKHKNSEQTNSLDIKWVIISLIISLVLAKFSKQSMCTYMYLSLAWLYIVILVTQSWRKFERDNIQIASTTIASLIGWLVGTLVVWRTRHHHNAFFE